MKYKVKLMPMGEVVEVEEGKNLLTALREQNIYVKSSCGGHATCSDCVIKVVSGEDYITPPPFNELKLLGNVFHITKERLACQTCVSGGDITIDIGKHDKAADEGKLRNKNFSKKKTVKSVVRKEADVQKIRADKMAERDEFDRAQKEKTDEWKNHWERDKSETPNGPKKLQGGKRPKFFDTDKVDYEKETYTRPLSPDKQKLRDDRLDREREEKLQKQHDKVMQEKSKDIPATSDKDFKKFRG
jgi:uncharacterized 2Fe-2S/4Fe-4S cluster protein (DUF4445 family)